MILIKEAFYLSPKLEEASTYFLPKELKIKVPITTNLREGACHAEPLENESYSPKKGS
jgi:hypothetical protein